MQPFLFMCHRGMKDYADQQRRLLQDIANLMLRNRDLLRQREEEERQRKEKQHEAEKQIEEAQNDESETQEAVEVPEVVALEEDVPQLVVPKDTTEKGNKQTSEKGEEQVKEEEIKPENETLVEHAKPNIEKMDIEESDGKKDENVGEKSAELDKEKTEHLLGAARKGEQFHLDLPLTSKIMTLESPAFIPESAMPVVVPPSEEEVAREAAEAKCSSSGIIS